ncbi:hypothetical protein EIP86_005232, partial [Pleurotus ostreatoroseus]
MSSLPEPTSPNGQEASTGNPHVNVTEDPIQNPSGSLEPDMTAGSLLEATDSLRSADSNGSSSDSQNTGWILAMNDSEEPRRLDPSRPLPTIPSHRTALQSRVLGLNPYPRIRSSQETVQNLRPPLPNSGSSHPAPQQHGITLDTEGGRTPVPQAPPQGGGVDLQAVPEPLSLDSGSSEAIPQQRHGIQMDTQGGPSSSPQNPEPLLLGGGASQSVPLRQQGVIPMDTGGDQNSVPQNPASGDCTDRQDKPPLKGSGGSQSAPPQGDIPMDNEG